LNTHNLILKNKINNLCKKFAQKKIQKKAVKNFLNSKITPNQQITDRSETNFSEFSRGLL